MKFILLVLMCTTLSVLSKDENIKIKYEDQKQMAAPEDHKRQSPINIQRGRVIRKRSYDKAFSYKYGKLQYSDAKRAGEHGVKFSFPDAEKGYLKTSCAKLFYKDAPEMKFTPAQFHFHSGTEHARYRDMGSEHTYNRKHYPLELHIVHMNDDEATQKYFLASVVGVMFRMKVTKRMTFADHFIQRLFTGKVVDTQKEFIDHLNLKKRYVYRGSLTTPKYNEFLLWNMVPKIVNINHITLSLFRHHIALADGKPAMWGEANRNVQPLNGRHVYYVF